MRILRLCLDRRVLAVLAGIAIGTALLAPRALGVALPVLFLAVCPLSMAVMVVAMGRGSAPATPATPAATAPPTPEVESMRTELDALAPL